MNNATQTAYDSLLVRFGKVKSTATYNDLTGYGKKLGKSDSLITADIWNVLTPLSYPAKPFLLKKYTDEQQFALDSCRGKVVLLTFWFPGCGPCRAEFPHFENVMKNFDRRLVGYLGINVYPDQDPYVCEIIDRGGISFTALRGNTKFASGTYDVGGYPSNFLIDCSGKVVFSDFMINEENEDLLALMINLTLKKP